MDGVSVSEVAVGMAALGGQLDLIAHGANRAGDHRGKGTIQCQHLFDPARIVLHDLAAPLEVSKALLAGIDNKHHGAFGGQPILQNKFHDHQHNRHIGRIVADAG